MADLTDEEMNSYPMEQINLEISELSFKSFFDKYVVSDVRDSCGGFVNALLNTKNLIVSKDLEAHTVTFTFNDSYFNQKIKSSVSFLVEHYDDISWKMVMCDFDIKAISNPLTKEQQNETR